MDADAWVMIPKSVNKGTECVIDMRPLVLCKNCKNFDTYNVECMKNNNLKPPYDKWFCADGEPKEGDPK